MPVYCTYFFTVLCFFVGLNILLPNEVLNSVVDNIVIEQIEDFDTDSENEDEKEEREELNDDNVMSRFSRNLSNHQVAFLILSLSCQQFNSSIYLDIDTPPPVL